MTDIFMMCAPVQEKGSIKEGIILSLICLLTAVVMVTKNPPGSRGRLTK